MVLVKDEETEKEELKPVVKDSFKTLKLLADAWRMAQEIDKAIPVLEKAASMAKNGETYILLGNLYLFEDRLEDAIKAIENGIKKGGLKRESQAHLVLGQAFFELEKFEDAKKYFRMAQEIKTRQLRKQPTPGLNILKMKQSEFKIYSSDESLLSKTLKFFHTHQL